MKYFTLPKTDINASRIVLGCMRTGKKSFKEVEALINTALDCGINFFDHADIYEGGESERVFGEFLSKNPSLRDKIYIQSKCGIHKENGVITYFDFSKKHILESVDSSLSRLKTDYLDVLLLHRPDTLMDPCEVAEAFDILKASGKVKYFGVSNQNPGHIELLQKFVKEPLCINQLQLSLAASTMIKADLNVNMENDSAVNRDGGILNYCRLHDITIQPWSPFQHGFFEGNFIDSPDYPELNKKLAELGEKYSAQKNAIAVAWLLRHSANMQPIIGTTTPSRVKEIAKAADITLTREEWYALFMSAGNILP